MAQIDIKSNLSKIKEKLSECERSSNRGDGSVKLVAVSKFHSEESVIAAIEAGQNLFGENRVQEAAAKFDSIREQGYTPELHIIGSLQRNKVKEAVRIASCIQSVDRIELLDEIEKHCSKIGKKITVFLEVHTGEETKSGFTSEEEIVSVLENCSKNAWPHISPKGFMTMAPNTTNSELVRNSFKTLRMLRDSMQKRFPMLDLSELSMGMSGDFQIAIEEGATIVRIGTAIFGEREYSK